MANIRQLTKDIEQCQQEIRKALSMLYAARERINKAIKELEDES